MSTSTAPTATTSRSSLESIFNSAFKAYNKKTGKDITTHPLSTELQSCHSPDEVLQALRNQIPQSQGSEEGFSKWLTPTINVLYAFSATLGAGVGLAFSPATVIFSGIGVLLLTAKDVGASQDTLIDLFSRIEFFFRRLEIYTGVQPTTAMMDIIIEILVEVLTILSIATKEVKRGRMKKYFRKLMGRTDIEESLQRLDRLTQEEARMASAEQLKITHSVGANVVAVDDRVKGVGERVQDVGGDVQGVGKKVEDVDSRVQVVDDKVQGIGDKVQSIDHKLDHVDRNQLRDSLLRWLLPPDPSTNHNLACKSHHTGTAQWFFRGSIFSQWKSTASLLWVHGKPGSGKSILCSSIVQDIVALHDAGRASMAYFYFDFRDVDKQKLNNLLPSLIIQLSARSDPCCDILSRLYSLHDRGVRKPSDRAMIQCLKEMLNVLAQGPTYIIMDALDECPTTSSIPSPREEVLDFVDELVGLHLPNLHICVTSRPEFDVQAVLEPLTARPVSLHDESGQKEDIADYVRSFVHSDRRMRRWREEDKELVIKTLPEKADGMFRWVFCQLEVLRHCFPPSVRRILEELPDSLDETYERILREIKKSNERHAHRLLQCLVVAVRPLRVQELAEVLAFDFNAEGIPKLNGDWRWEDQEEAVMSACSSLVIVAKDGDSRIVQFSHFSVKEFLTSSRLFESGRDVSRYHILLEPAHTILAQACLGVLLRLDDRINVDSMKNFPLAGYAAEHWVSHAQFESVASHIKDGMKVLFDVDEPHFATWLRIYRDEGAFSTFRGSSQRPAAVPLYYAARHGFRGLVEHLIARHPEDVNAKGGHYGAPLHVALRERHVDVASLLIEHGADVNLRASWNWTPLFVASAAGLPDIIQWLLNHDANVNARSESDWTSLHLAAYYGEVEACRTLIANNAEVNARNNGNNSPLHLASAQGRVEVVRLLLDLGADPSARDKEGMTPASSAQRQEVAQLLSEYGAKQERP